MFLVALGYVSARAAVDGGTGGVCMLPTGLPIPCTVAAECVSYNATCSIPLGSFSGSCSCFASSGADLGHANHDAGGVDGDGGGGSGGSGGGGSGGSGGGFSGGSVGATGILGGGMTSPIRSGCSFIPGQR